MALDDLWFAAEEATQRGEQAYHRLTEEDPLVFERTDHVSRRRFRTLTGRIRRTGTPYGVHTIVHDDGEVLLVRHEGVDLWVLPGGMPEGDETAREAARRELREEAGVAVEYEGLAALTRVAVRHGQYATVGVIPVFAARAESRECEVADPDEEISAARWFETLPPDTRDRAVVEGWREEVLACRS